MQVMFFAAPKLGFPTSKSVFRPSGSLWNLQKHPFEILWILCTSADILGIKIASCSILFLRLHPPWHRQIPTSCWLETKRCSSLAKPVLSWTERSLLQHAAAISPNCSLLWLVSTTGLNGTEGLRISLEVQSPTVVWRTFPGPSLFRYRFQTRDCFGDYREIQHSTWVILVNCNSSEVQPEKLAAGRPPRDHSNKLRWIIPLRSTLYSQPQDLHLQCMKGNIPLEKESVPSVTWKAAHIGAEPLKITRVGLSDQIHCLIAGGMHPCLIFCIARIPSFAFICTWIMDYKIL